MATKKETAAAVEEVKTVGEKKPAPKKTAKKAEKKTLTIKLVRSFAHRLDNQIATCKSLGLKKIGQSVEKADNEAIRGMVRTVAHLVTCEEV